MEELQNEWYWIILDWGEHGEGYLLPSLWTQSSQATGIGIHIMWSIGEHVRGVYAHVWEGGSSTFSSPTIPTSISGTSVSESLDIQSLCTLYNTELARSHSKWQLDGENWFPSIFSFSVCSLNRNDRSTLFRMVPHLQIFFKTWVLVLVKIVIVLQFS